MLRLFCFVRLTFFSFLTCLGKHRFLRKSNITGAWRFSFDFSLPFLLQTCFLFILKSNISAMRFIHHQTSFHVAKIWPCATCVGARPSCGKEKMWYGKTFVASGSRRYFVFSSCWNTFWSGHRFPVTNLLTCQNPDRREELERALGGGGGGGGLLPIYTCNLKGKGLKL